MHGSPTAELAAEFLALCQSKSAVLSLLGACTAFGCLAAPLVPVRLLGHLRRLQEAMAVWSGAASHAVACMQRRMPHVQVGCSTES